MKAFLFSNAPWVSTGYGVQAAHILPRLAERYGPDNVACAVNYGLQGVPQRWQSIRIYPSGLTPYSDDIAPIHALQFLDGQPGIVITLVDVWCLQNPAWNKLDVAAWTPIDHVPCPPPVTAFFERTGARPVAMSRFGERQLADAGHHPTYIPLAVDTTVFRPRDGARSRVGWPESAFVVGMVAMNKTAPSRKGFAEAFVAFGRFKQSHPDALLYVHAETSPIMGGLDLERLVAMCGLDRDDVQFADPYQLHVGYPSERLADIYAAMDVLIAPSYGEGFCVPLIEAQACGTPVIATDFSAQTELVGAGHLIHGQPFADPTAIAWYVIPSIDETVAALTDFYDHPLDRCAARKFAWQYDIDTVWKTYWEPFLTSLQSET